MITVYSYAIEILTTNRTDSLQYTALIAAYKACPPYGGSNSVPLALNASVLSNALSGPHHLICLLCSGAIKISTTSTFATTISFPIIGSRGFDLRTNQL